MGSDCNMIRPSLGMEAGLNREWGWRSCAPGAASLPLHYTEDKLLTLECTFLIQERGLWGKQ